MISKRDRIDKGFRKILNGGMKAGLFSKHDPKLISFVILGAINWIPRWYNPAGQATSYEIANLFADYLVAGLHDGGQVAVVAGASGTSRRA